jgi:hypothetical protein
MLSSYDWKNRKIGKTLEGVKEVAFFSILTVVITVYPGNFV